MIEPDKDTKYLLWNPNASSSQNELEWFDTIDEVTQYMTAEKLLPDEEGVIVYELAKEIKFKLVPA